MTSADDATPEADRPPVPWPPPFNGFPPIHPGYPPAFVPPRAYRPAPVPLAPDGRPLADFGSRLLAYVIDSALVGAVLTAIAVPAVLVVFFTNVDLSAPEPGPTGFDSSSYGSSWVTDAFWPFVLLEIGFVVFTLVAYYVYYVEMMYRRGQTFGKKMIGIKVVPIEPGATMTRGRAARRYLVEIVAGTFVPFFHWLNGLWQLWDKPYQQTLHDKAAQTVVIKVAP